MTKICHLTINVKLTIKNWSQDKTYVGTIMHCEHNVTNTRWSQNDKYHRMTRICHLKVDNQKFVTRQILC